MRILAIAVLSFLTFASLPTMAQQAAPAPDDAEKLVLEKIKLTHRKPVEMMQLLAPHKLDGRGIPLTNEEPKAVAPGLADHPLGPEDSVLPVGIQGILAFQLDGSLIVRGTLPSVEALKRGIRVADVEVVHPSKDQAIALLTPQRIKPGILRERVLKLPGAGSAAVRGEQVGVEGSSAWVDQAVRVAIRAETAEP